MRRISDYTTSIIASDPHLLFGFQNDLFNLSQLARFITPLVEARTKKSISHAAMVMNLSRIQHNFKKRTLSKIKFNIDNLTIHSNLLSTTFRRSPQTVRNLATLFERHPHMFLAESLSTSEITIIADQTLAAEVRKISKEAPIIIKKDLSAIGVKFSERYFDVPGLFLFLIQNITLQGVNIYEISSTYTEILFFVQKDDLKIVFDTFSSIMER